MNNLISQKKVLIEHFKNKNKEQLLQQLINKKKKNYILKENKTIHQPVKFPINKNKDLIHKTFIIR